MIDNVLSYLRLTQHLLIVRRRFWWW